LAVSSIAVAVLGADVNKQNFDPFTSNVGRQNDVKRLQALTTGTPFTTFCVDKVDQKTPLVGGALSDCKTALAKELVDLQIQVQRDFFDAFIKFFSLFGTPFDRNKINNFDNLAECQREVNTFSDFLDAAQITSVKNFCANVKLAADNLRETVRAQLAAEQAKPNNQARVDLGLAKLDRAHLAVFDKTLNVQQQNQFVDLTEDAERAKQSFEGFLLGQLSATVLEFNKGNYRNYKADIVAKADLQNEVQQLINLAKAELAKNQLIVDAAKRLNALALAPTPQALAVQGALKLAALRKETVDAPLAIQWRISDVDPTQEADIIKSFTDSLGPESFFLKSVKQANGKLVIDFATGMDVSDIGTRDSEFGLTCVQKAVTCTVVEDVHQAAFDLAQYKEVEITKKKVVDDGYGDEPAHVTHVNQVHDAASSLFLAAGALIASVVLFL